MICVGVTGVMGVGKSTVAGWYARRGIPVISADAVYADLTADGGDLLGVLEGAFGSILSPDGSLDRKALSAVVFGDAGKRQQLEALTWPAIIAQIHARLQDLCGEGHAWCLLEAPRLFAADLQLICDEVWWVFAPRAVCIARATARTGLPRDDIERRLAVQPTDAFLAANCHRQIDLTHGVESANPQLWAQYVRMRGAV